MPHTQVDVSFNHRRKWSWTSLQLRRAKAVQAVVKELEAYWPLTLRQIYYRLVAKGLIENTRSQYNMLSKLVKWMRFDDMLPWSVLEDRTRTLSEKRGYEDLREFVNTELHYFLNGYARCLVQGQEAYIEVWVEKEALYRVFQDVAYPYCIRTIACKGYQSITFIADFAKRARMAQGNRQQVIVLYFGDLDPSGVQMLEATKQTLENEMELQGVQFKRVALNPEHVRLYSLPTDPEAVKLTDPRYKRYIAQFGHLAVELDALHPAELTKLARMPLKATLIWNCSPNNRK